MNVADLMVRTDEQRVIGIVEKRADSRDLGVAGLLPGPRGIEADNNERIDAGEERAVQRTCAGIGAALGLPDRMAGP
jgi:hypothetical protein